VLHSCISDGTTVLNKVKHGDVVLQGLVLLAILKKKKKFIFYNKKKKNFFLSPFVIFLSVRFGYEKSKNLFFYFSLWFLSGSRYHSLAYSACKPEALFRWKSLRPSFGVYVELAVVVEGRQKVGDCR
jgi:hypothetical protein